MGTSAKLERHLLYHEKQRMNTVPCVRELHAAGAGVWAQPTNLLVVRVQVGELATVEQHLLQRPKVLLSGACKVQPVPTGASLVLSLEHIQQAVRHLQARCPACGCPTWVVHVV